ncbi:hypothetical protein MMC13_006167 [Lambiella insularis]|nr:hypothetical protein [Lambiella insularis]
MKTAETKVSSVAAIASQTQRVNNTTGASTFDGHRVTPQQHRVDGSNSTTPMSRTSSRETYDTHATSMFLTPLQTSGATDSIMELEPLEEDDPESYDLVPPPVEGRTGFSLEARSDQLFSREHLQIIFSDPSLLLRFTAFLSTHRPQSIAVLIYYLDAVKALKAIAYANAVAEALQPIIKYDFTIHPARHTVNSVLEEKALKSFNVMVHEDLPAYITYQYIQLVSLSVSRRITGTLAPHLREASEGLAEVFCLTDPSRPDNPIVFASEEFYKTTQYGVKYAIGRNCRFLQGPKTNPSSAKRLKESIETGKEHCEVRRDGSPFMNMLMTAPLCDSRGNVRYFVGAQVDVSGLVKDCAGMESLQRLVIQQSRTSQDHDTAPEIAKKDYFQELSEMLNISELETVRRWGGRMHREQQDDENEGNGYSAVHRPRIVLKDSTPGTNLTNHLYGRRNGLLSGVFQNYLLLRPYPALRILFASPSMRVPGILQSPFMEKIGGASRVRDMLTAALAEGRGVTAQIRWMTKFDEDGRNRWVHCTPLLGSNGRVGVWMVVLIDEEDGLSRRWRQAPPVPSNLDSSVHSDRNGEDRDSEYAFSP